MLDYLLPFRQESYLLTQIRELPPGLFFVCLFLSESSILLAANFEVLFNQLQPNQVLHLLGSIISLTLEPEGDKFDSTGGLCHP